MAVSEVIYSILITSISGVIFGILTVLYKSKCKHINICGIVIERDVEGEEKVDIDANHTTHNLV